MSNEAREWVWVSSPSRGVDRLVMLALAEEASPLGVRCWPSQVRIAERVGVNRATVRRSIVRLEAAGELLVRRPAVTGRGRFTRYALVMGRDAAELLSSLDATWSNIAPRLFPQPVDDACGRPAEKARSAVERARSWGEQDPSPRSRPIQSPLVAVVEPTVAAAAERRARDMARQTPVCGVCGDDGRVVDESNTVAPCPGCRGVSAM